MNQLPDFWRTEIWHPLSVHLPLVLLLVGTIFLSTGIVAKRKFWLHSGYVLIILGAVGAWMAVFTGNMADGVVSREICDPTVLKSHENGGKIVAWLFTVASGLILLDYFKSLQRFRTTLLIVLMAVVLTGSGFLLYTGHLGAQLVYQQAAGVYTPTDDCLEFVED
ncbi:MAG: DUF2231 domain-containing protein [Bacteroidota bacterium]